MSANVACKLRSLHERHLTIKVIHDISASQLLSKLISLNLLTYFGNKLSGTRLSFTFPTEHTTLLRRCINVDDVDSTSQQRRVPSGLAYPG